LEVIFLVAMIEGRDWIVISHSSIFGYYFEIVIPK